MRFDDSKIEEIKSRVDIVELASEYLTLKKAGRNYLGLCPFHQEKTPSFTVNREKQIFYCFGCGEGGNVITLLMKIANKSFPEAIKYLAEKTGVLLPVRTFGGDGREKESLRDEIFQLNARAAQYFARQLSSPGAKRSATTCRSEPSPRKPSDNSGWGMRRTPGVPWRMIWKAAVYP